MSTGSPLVKFLGWNPGACFFRSAMIFYPQSGRRGVIIRVKTREASAQNWLTRSCYSWQGRSSKYCCTCYSSLETPYLFFSWRVWALQVHADPYGYKLIFPQNRQEQSEVWGQLRADISDLWGLSLPHCTVLIFLLRLFRAARCCSCWILNSRVSARSLSSGGGQLMVASCPPVCVVFTAACACPNL